MSAQAELTLGELARIALGTPQLGPANIAVLHSLIDLLLKKLDCRDERISVGGYESGCLRKLLEKTSIPSYAFQEDQLEILTDKFERMSALEKRVEAVDTRLEKHFDEIRECNKQSLGDVFNYKNWDHYAGVCEDLCVPCEPESQLACELITNTDFMKNILRRVSFPLVERMFNFEQQVERLHADFSKFMEKTKDHYMKMALVEHCIHEIEQLRQQVDEHHVRFLAAMEEIQDMFDAKLDKIHLPALKKYVRDRFDKIESTLHALRNEKTCPPSGGVIMNGIKCLSCGNEQVCTEKSVVVKGVMPDSHVRNVPKLTKQFCGCHYPPRNKSVKVTEHYLQMVPRSPAVQMVNIQAETCKEPEHGYTLKEGKDGRFYRMDTRDKSGKTKSTREHNKIDVDAIEMDCERLFKEI